MIVAKHDLKIRPDRSAPEKLGAPVTCERKGKSFGGDDPKVAEALIRQLRGSLPPESREDLKSIKNALSLVQQLGPTDQLEGLLAVQMVATHTLAMEFVRITNANRDQRVVLDSCITWTTKLLRLFAQQVDALGRYRRRGEQHFTVHHVSVNNVGQAVVGNLVPQGVRSSSPQDGPHAKRE